MRPSPSRRRRVAAPVIALIAGLTFLFVGTRTAFADTVGADIPLLIELIANSAEQLTELRESLAVLRQTYSEAKRVAAYADDARNTFEAFANTSPEDLTSGADHALSNLLPELNDFRGTESGVPEWTRGSGELSGKLTFCLAEALRRGSSTDSCTEIRRALTMEESREALAATFGHAADSAPPDVRASDHEAAVALSASSSLESRAALARLKAKALLSRCEKGGADAPSKETCEAAAHEAEVLQLEALSHVSDGVSETARLSALQLEQKNAERKRELQGKAERDAAVMAGFRALQSPAPTLRVDSPSVLGASGISSEVTR